MTDVLLLRKPVREWRVLYKPKRTINGEDFPWRLEIGPLLAHGKVTWVRGPNYKAPHQTRDSERL